MRCLALWLACSIALLSGIFPARGTEPTPPEGAATPAAPSVVEGAVAPERNIPPNREGPLDPAEKEILLRIAWRTLTGHLTKNPIQDRDLEGYRLTPRLTAARGCFITLRKGDEVRGKQGEIEPTRPLYQQVIVFTRRAATRDARFLPLTDRDLPGLTLEIAVLGDRSPVAGPSEIQIDRHGIFLEKWGRRSLFLPGEAVSKGWGPERTLDELCRQAALPAGAWKQGAKVEIFTAEIVAGPEPPPIAAAPIPPAPAANEPRTPADGPSPAGEETP